MGIIDLVRSKIPAWIFWVGMLLVVSWIFLYDFFPTYDGPSHLYNSFLMLELQGNKSILLLDHFQWNKWWVPNSLGHWIQSLFLTIFSPLVAEKLLVIFVVLSLAGALQVWVKVLNLNNNWILVSMLPLLFSDIFFFGFFNFLLGLSGLILAWAFWFYSHNKVAKLNSFLIWLPLFLSIYFSHLVTFLFAGLGLFTLEIVKVASYKTIQWKRIGNWLFAMVLPGLGALFYYANPTLNQASEWLSIEDLVNRFFSGHILVAFDFSREGPFSIAFVVLNMALLLFAGFYRFVKKIRNPSFEGRAIGVLCILILVLYFVLPNSISGGGFLSDRILLLFFFVFVLWLGIYFQKYVWVLGFAGLASLLVFLGLFRYHRAVYNTLEEKIVVIEKVSQKIPKNSVVLPIFRDTNWYTKHHAKYIGILSESILLNNYEAETGYFPIIWNYETIPNYRIGDKEGMGYPCDSWTSNPNNKHRSVDYILWQGTPNENEKKCKDYWDLSLREDTTVRKLM